MNCSANAKPENHNGSVNPNSYPYSEQSSGYSYQQGASGDAIRMFAPSQLPIKTTLATEFGVFNRLFSAVPGFSAPNHMMMQVCLCIFLCGSVSACLSVCPSVYLSVCLSVCLSCLCSLVAVYLSL